MGKNFNDRIAFLVSGKLSERLTERFEEAIRTTEAFAEKAVRKSVYPMRRGEIPFSNSKVTNGRKAIRRMFDLKPFSEMAYK
jgi:predicted nucleotidyltransferase